MELHKGAKYGIICISGIEKGYHNACQIYDIGNTTRLSRKYSFITDIFFDLSRGLPKNPGEK